VEIFQVIASQISISIQNAILYSTLQQQSAIIEKQNREFTNQLRLAQALQESMIPPSSIAIEGLTIEFLYEPAMQVGGDLLDILQLENGEVIIFLGDAMGHGVRAAMMMAAAKTALHNSCSNTSNPAQILRQMNEQLFDVVDDVFLTGLCILIEPSRQTLQWSSAGHPYFWKLENGNGEAIQSPVSGFPLGIMQPSEKYETTYSSFQKGNTIVLCTDGVIEMCNQTGEQFGCERFVNILNQERKVQSVEMLDIFRSDLKRHQGGSAPNDDITMVVIKAMG
jgi:phosphoserine phosphatase RsbU/P